MVLKGLDTYGKYGLSHEIGTEHLHAVVEVFKKHNTMYENYAPEWIDQGGPSKGFPARPDFVGWTGLVPISVMFEYVFGIKPEADKRKIFWHVELLERHGIEKYPFGVEGELTLICQARREANDPPQITFRSNVPVTLEVAWGDPEHQQSMLLKS